MKITAMMSFWDEDPTWLRSSIEDLVSLGASRVLACDGAYALFLGGLSKSPDNQIAAIRQSCDDLDVELLLYQPPCVWLGNEVEKRQKMLDLALAISDREDWLAIWDVDYELVNAPDADDIHDRLLSARADVAGISFTESLSGGGWHQMRMFMRASPGIKMDGNHHTYLLPDGRRSQVLCRLVPNAASAIDLSAIKIYHRVHERTALRRHDQTRYYEERDSRGIET